jgi:hypothetical protein
MTTPKPETLPSFYVPDDDAASEWTPAPWPDRCPEPGIYHDIPFEEYRRWPAITREVLRYCYEVTPKHAKAYIDGELPDKDTKDRRGGRAIHCLLLEPDRWAERFLVASPCCEPIASGKRKGQPCNKTGRFYLDPLHDEPALWYCGVHKHEDAAEPHDYISEEQWAGLSRIRAAVFGHNVVKVLRTLGGCEVSLVWERDGLPCKCRLDKMIDRNDCPRTIIDLKKIKPAKGTDKALQKAIGEHRYDVQAYWYTEAAKQLTGTPFRFIWIYHEDGPPFDVRPVWATPKRLEVGRCKVNRAWRIYLHSLQGNEWPGYTDDIDVLEPEDWELKRYGIG